MFTYIFEINIILAVILWLIFLNYEILNSIILNSVKTVEMWTINIIKCLQSKFVKIIIQLYRFSKYMQNMALSYGQYVNLGKLLLTYKVRE